MASAERRPRPPPAAAGPSLAGVVGVGRLGGVGVGGMTEKGSKDTVRRVDV